MRLRAFCAACILSFGGLMGSFAAVAQSEKPLLIFAASSLAGVLEPALAGKKEGGKAKIAYAGSGSLARQVAAGAQADLFISANRQWVEFLGQAGLVDEARSKKILSNRLVIATVTEKESPDGLAAKAFIADMLKGRLLAMGNPAFVPAGEYGKFALEGLGLWKEVQPQLVFTDSVRAATALVARGEVPFGLVYKTDAKAAGLNIAATLAEDTHPPIRYIAVPILNGRTSRVEQLVDELMSAEAQDVFASFGFPPLK